MNKFYIFNIKYTLKVRNPNYFNIVILYGWLKISK